MALYIILKDNRETGSYIGEFRVYRPGNGEKKLQDEIIDTISGSTNFIFAGIMVIVAILVVIVNISYMRDRRSEWCLYSSIGYSRKAVYYSILREMLFVFVTALLTAAVVSIIFNEITGYLSYNRTWAYMFILYT